MQASVGAGVAWPGHSPEFLGWGRVHLPADNRKPACLTEVTTPPVHHCCQTQGPVHDLAKP